MSGSPFSNPFGPQRHVSSTQALLVIDKWRKRVGVEPTGDKRTCRPPVLKTGTITGPHALPFAAMEPKEKIRPERRCGGP